MFSHFHQENTTSVNFRGVLSSSWSGNTCHLILRRSVGHPERGSTATKIYLLLLGVVGCGPATSIDIFQKRPLQGLLFLCFLSLNDEFKMLPVLNKAAQGHVIPEMHSKRKIKASLRSASMYFSLWRELAWRIKVFLLKLVLNGIRKESLLQCLRFSRKYLLEGRPHLSESTHASLIFWGSSLKETKTPLKSVLYSYFKWAGKFYSSKYISRTVKWP